MYHPRTITSVFISLCLAFVLYSCGSSGLKIEGTLEMEYAGGQKKPIANRIVLLIPDSTVTPFLEKKRDEFTTELTIQTGRKDALYAVIDSMMSQYQKGSTPALLEKIEALKAEAATLKKTRNDFRLEYVVFTARELAKRAIKYTSTNDKGAYQFDQLAPGDYAVVSVYEEADHSGFFLKRVSLTKANATVDLDPYAIEKVLVYEPEK